MLRTSQVIRRKNFGFAPITLLPQLPDDVAVKLSVRYPRESVMDSLHDVKLFLDICELGQDLINRINLCCEELMNNIAEFGKTKSIARKSDSAVFEVRLKEKADRIIVSFKDAGKPFNPIAKFKPANLQSYSEVNLKELELRLLNGICGEIEYKYNFGLNVTMMNFMKK